MSTITVDGPRRFIGRLRVPGDKSISHRALMIAALGHRPCRIRGLSDGDDVVHTRRAVQALGAQVENIEPGEVTVTGGLSGARESIYLGNSGTGIRLLAGMVANRDFVTTLDGDSSVRRRPMDRIIVPLSAMGASILGSGAGGSLAPLTIEGRALRGIEYTLPVASAQVKGAVLLAALRAGGPTTVHEPVPTRTHTEEMLAAAGVRVESDNGSVTVWPGEVVPPHTLRVPGDPSQAAFWLVGACLTAGSDLTVESVYLGRARAGFLDVLRRMGADIAVDSSSGDIRARYRELRATRVAAGELPGCIDEIPILAVAAAMAEGVTVVEGIAELRVKETDRVAAIAEMLAALGRQCRIDGDTLEITGGGGSSARKPRKPGRWIVDSRGDHRMAMAAAIAGAVGAGSVTVEGFEATTTSYPGFARDLSRSTGWTP
ncbi:3-phosphoshikimate 1-carboxyvinyltransferase [Candidatus Poriferisocius sp.]|uniref:3-phosphoshikimate 1-carboxyvinyltransferase n=1 Tax=Candidatus Poriferisocius sp. TaxID=3101276 RepID=UPI003B01CF47